MSWFSGNPQPGDWIKTTDPIKVTFTDYLLGDDGGIKPGNPMLPPRAHGLPR